MIEIPLSLRVLGNVFLSYRKSAFNCAPVSLLPCIIGSIYGRKKVVCLFNFDTFCTCNILEITNMNCLIKIELAYFDQH